MPVGDELIGELADSPIPNAIEQMARLRAMSLLRECARMIERGPWEPGAAEKFMQQDTAEFHLRTNQGEFVIVVRRG